VALRQHRGINDWQLRFRLSGDYAFSNHGGGWSARPDSAWELGLRPELVELAMSQPVAGLPLEPSTDIERKADVAIRWLERARFASEPIIAMLYLFFGLEALLGDTSEGLKAPALAFRQAMLSHVVAQGFTHPNETFFLYDQIRSGAVHGEDVPSVFPDDVRRFDWAVRTTLNEYLTYAKAEGFTRRSRLVKGLEAHPDRPKLMSWLRTNGGDAWRQYLGPAPDQETPAMSAPDP
jgi:hypothetical protein